MYKLRRNTTEPLFEGSGRTEKEDHNVYLFVSQWDALDQLAEVENKSRNQVLREILNDYFSRGEDSDK